MLAVGIDAVNVAELERMVLTSTDKNHFLISSWREDELDYCGDDLHRLAGRWAVKEATLKALGTGIGPLSPLDVGTVATDGAPALVLHGKVRDVSIARGLVDWSVSITHEENLAIAIVIGSKGCGC